MEDELAQLTKQNAWTIEDRPENTNIVGSKWVYRLKRDNNWKVDAYRARLVAQGYSQVEGLDYYADETFASVVKLPSVRAILSIAAKEDWEIEQIDIKSAYLYGKLNPDEKVYLAPPKIVTIPGIKPNQVLKLNVTIYGLKQAGR